MESALEPASLNKDPEDAGLLLHQCELEPERLSRAGKGGEREQRYAFIREPRKTGPLPGDSISKTPKPQIQELQGMGLQEIWALWEI